MTDGESELACVVALDGPAKAGARYQLTADEVQCAAIATRLRVNGVMALSGEIELRASRKKIDITGVLKALLVRECVSSLEEFQEPVEERFELELLRSEPETIDPDAPSEVPEVHEGETIDLGEILIQQLALSMSPFPRKTGAESLVARFGVEPERSAFAQALIEASKKDN